MNKQEFLNQLRAALAPLPAVEREDILADYEEHFRIAGETGHSEETVAAALGDPRELARIYIEGMDPPPFDPTDPTLGGKAAYPYAKGSRASNGHPWIVTGVVLFNVFIGAWMLLGLIGAWIGLWMVPIAIALAGIASSWDIHSHGDVQMDLYFSRDCPNRIGYFGCHRYGVCDKILL